jgi:hypothetical protein
MGNRETSFLGAITLRLMRDLPAAQAGWLVHALAVWIMDGELPDDADVPPECLGAWIAIREESIAICETRKARADAGRVGGSKPKQTEAKPSKPKQTEAEAKQTEARARAGLELELEKELEYTDGVPLARAPEREEDEPADNGTAVETSPSSNDNGDERIKETSFEAWARLQPDPVAVALDVTGESREKKGVYGKRLRKLGRDRFLDVVCGFRAQVAAGETVRNPGAALTAQLNEAVTAMEACAG